ncbi:hypothetical protein DRO26_04210 [Candidatus Bathyarchaeota archaeon]|nr:MAG: hypothetical protein DRO26_04210 [Candidatus Bathyarchaeota archaeon]
MRKLFLTVWFTFLILLDYLVPYTILQGYNKITGLYVFWPLLTLVVAVSCFWLMTGWREK